MKRQQFIKHLERQNCSKKRTSGGHHIYYNGLKNLTTAVPAHGTEIHQGLAMTICKQLGINKP